MRKYYQAILLVTAVISLISLLFYRHEYNKLRYVLEVFNYFGQPRQDRINCTNILENIKYHLNLSQPLTSWQRLDDNFYIYSSYIINNRINTIAYGDLKSLDLECNVFFSDHQASSPGRLSFKKIDNSSYVHKSVFNNGYILTCDYDESLNPVSVNYQSSQRPSKIKLPIFSVKNQPNNLSYNGTALCVNPPFNIPVVPAEMISFLNFHELIGMDHFVIYDYGIPVQFHKAIEVMISDINPQWKFTYEVIPWNFPYSEAKSSVIRKMVETECLHRTFNKVMYASTLSWEEYIVLKHHQSVSDLMIELDKSKMTANRFMVQTQNFCTQQTDDKRTTKLAPIILRKLNATQNSQEDVIYIDQPHESMKSPRSRKIYSNYIMVNRYVACDNYDPSMKQFYEPSILRFGEDFQYSPINTRFISGKMFQDEYF